MINVKRLILLLFFCGVVTCSFGQDESVMDEVNDSTSENTLEVDEIIPDEDEATYWGDSKDYTAPSDSAKITPSSFSEAQIDELKKDPDLQYKEIPTVAESLWSRILAWISEFFTSLFEGAVTTNWGRVISYVLGIAVLVIVIMMLLKVNAFKVFYSGDGATVQHNVIEENIHEMDFEKLIQQALDQKDYRKGVRLIFLFSLKMLSDKHLIDWEQGKTNHDYVDELKHAELKSGFNELSFYFDYAWYGNFAINAETFSKVQAVFSEWRTKVR